MSKAVKCPKCGIGWDTNGDGDCPACAGKMDFGEKGVNPETGCISVEEHARREKIDMEYLSTNKIQIMPYQETLRDRFAMAALTGLLASCSGPAWGVNTFPVGDTCYEYADQMLKARDK